MAILIKGMEMPKNCAGCFLRFGQCSRRIYMENRPSDCPLNEVPEPHGRLIDARLLKETLDYYIREAGWSDEINKALNLVKDEFINSEPTVIPANPAEEG